MCRWHGKDQTCDHAQKNGPPDSALVFCKYLDAGRRLAVASGWAKGGRGLWESNKTILGSQIHGRIKHWWNLQSQLGDCPLSPLSVPAQLWRSWTWHSWGNSLSWQLCCWWWKGPWLEVWELAVNVYRGIHFGIDFMIGMPRGRSSIKTQAKQLSKPDSTKKST